jgi:hypothetical protein
MWSRLLIVDAPQICLEFKRRLLVFIIAVAMTIVYIKLITSIDASLFLHKK